MNLARVASDPAMEPVARLGHNLCGEYGVELLGHEPVHPGRQVCGMCLEAMLETGEIER